MGENFPDNFAKGAAVVAALGAVAAPVAMAQAEAPTPKVANKKEIIADDYVNPIVSQIGASALTSELEVSFVEDRPKRHIRHRPSRFTGYEVTGATSTFGWPSDGSGQTADQGSVERPCIALRNDSTLDHKFQVTVFYHHKKHQAEMIQCDWGPATWTGRNIDITGQGVEKLHLNPYAYPTGAWGIVRELKKHQVNRRVRASKPKQYIPKEVKVNGPHR